jgi:hypothetical protein
MSKDVRGWLQAQEPRLSDPKAMSELGKVFLSSVVENVNTVDPHPSKFAILTGEEIKNQDPPQWQIADMWPVGSFVVIYGEPASGKSFLTLDFALSILNGVAWLDKDCSVGTALYIATEGQGGLGKRLRAWEVGHPERSSSQLLVIITSPQFVNSDDTADLVAAIEALPEQPSLIVIDTMARTMGGGDENSAKDVGQFVAAVDKLRRAFNATVLVVHHSGKDGKTERGSSALRGAADVILKVEREGNAMFILTCEKSKDSEAFPPRWVQLLPVELKDGTSSCYLKAAFCSPSVASQKENMALTALNRLCESEERVPYGTWQAASELTKNTFDRGKRPPVPYTV